MNKQELIALLQKYVDGNANERERALVETWYNKTGHESSKFSNDLQLEQKAKEIWQELNRPSVIRMRVYRYMAAAVLLITLGIGFFFMVDRKGNAWNATQEIALDAAEILPGKNTAQLLLGDGRVVDLNEEYAGIVVSESGVSYMDGDQITELSADLPKDALAYRLVTPNGGQYQLTLSDGTKVWLNAASSLSYPKEFDSSSRSVRLEGEAYFEVTKDVKRPFKVITDHQEIDVLGTQFNVNCYADEPVVQTTVVTGAVRVKSKAISQEAVLSPGEQAETDMDGNINVHHGNMATALAWKQGVFQFEGTSIEHIMRQFSRWYDVEVVYQGDKPNIKLWGKVDRDADAADALAILSYFNLKYQTSLIGEKKRITVYH